MSTLSSNAYISQSARLSLCIRSVAASFSEPFHRASEGYPKGVRSELIRQGEKDKGPKPFEIRIAFALHGCCVVREAPTYPCAKTADFMAPKCPFPCPHLADFKPRWGGGVDIPVPL